MKRVLSGNLSQWSVERDDEKLAFILSVIEERFGDEARQGELARFLDFLMSEDCYKYSAHLLRYVETFSRICKTDLSGRIVETGGSSPILDYLACTNDKCECFHTESDLRLEMDCEDGFADVIFSFEVLEHIKDRPETSFDEVVLFQGTGAQTFADEVARVAKTGADVFLTTPNPVSSISLENLLNGTAPMVFRPHVREYTKDEILGLFGELKLVNYQSMYNFFQIKGGACRLKEVFESAGASSRGRGDDHFFHFRRA